MNKANIVVNSAAGTAVLLIIASWGLMSGRAEGGPEEIVDAQGALHVPQNYRSTYQMLGSWAVAAEQGPGSKEIHSVYASPGVAQSYKNNGLFADGTVLVKEVFEAATEQMTTGTVSRAGKLKGWFVMMKDSKNHYPANKLWGDGWGWSWFDADNPSRTTSTDYQSDCQSCHSPAQSTDWVYVDGYPSIKR